MKRIILSFIILLAAQIGLAQEEVAIEQNINAPIGCLSINAGWEVRLMNRNTDSYRLAVVVPDRFAGIAAETQVCNLKGDTLTILKNDMLPQETILELEGPLELQEIVLFTEAKATFDRLVIPEKAVKYEIYIGEKSEMTVHQMIFNGEPFIRLGNESKLTIDTIQGCGKPFIETYNAQFQYGKSLLDGEIVVKEFKKPSWFYYEVHPPKVIKTEMKDGKPVTTERYKIWNASVALDAGIGFRKHQNPVDFNSPFTNNGILAINIGLSTGFRFSDRWTLSTGLRYNFNTYYMAHQLKLNENGLETIDGQTPIQQNELANDYLGIPVELRFSLGEQWKSSLSVDAFFGRRIQGVFRTRGPEDNYKDWNIEKAASLFNPWKLEVGFSVNTSLIGFIHGIRVYTNLLPEYNKAVTTEKFRSIGVEIKF